MSDKFTVQLESFHHLYDIDTHFEYDCDHYGCNDDYCCRCGKVIAAFRQDTILYEPDLVVISQSYKDKIGRRRKRRYKLSKIEEYCIERLWTIHSLYKPQNWNIKVESGYYGEEIEGVHLDDDLKDKFLNDVLHIINHCPTNLDKIKHILKAEYSFLLLKIDKSNNELVCVVDTIHNTNRFSQNDNYFGRVKKKDLLYPLSSFYEDETNPIGVVYYDPDTNVYQMIDGYHRLSRFTDKENKQFVVIKPAQEPA